MTSCSLMPRPNGTWKKFLIRNPMSNNIVELLQSEIESYKREIRLEKVGHVLEVGDGIAKVSGLSGVASQEMLQFETSEGSVIGIAFNLEEDMVGAIVLGNYLKVKEGDVVKPLGR